MQTRFGACVIFLKHFTFNPILMWIYSLFVVGCCIKEHQKRKKAHQSHTLSPLCLFLLASFTMSLSLSQTLSERVKRTLYRSGVRLIYPAEFPPWLISINHMSVCL